MCAVGVLRLNGRWGVSTTHTITHEISFFILYDFTVLFNLGYAKIHLFFLIPNKKQEKKQKMVLIEMNLEIICFKENRYSNINHFVCMGFSFNNIDMPYIEKIIKVNKSISDTDWTVYWHSDQEDVRIQKLLFALGINQSQIQLVRW